MSIVFDVEGVEKPSINQKQIKDWIKQVASQFNLKVGELAYLFCSDEKILEVNKEYLQHDYYTDIITFDYSEGNVISGDMFISLDTVKSNAEKYGTAYNEELLRVMIHGILHLCGLKDKTDEEEKTMRAEENKALGLILEKE